MDDTEAVFGDTRTIRTGGATKQELLLRLDRDAIQLNDYATALFAHPGFTTSSKSHEVRVAFVSMADIGLPQGGSYQDILTQAATKGLEPCPLEVAPQLRLDYLDQPEGPYLTVASLELRPGPETPNGFYLRRLEGELWLRGYESGPENIYQPGFTRFVFMYP